jgi:hypothetical protein
MCAPYSPSLSNVSAQWTVLVLQGEFVARLYDGNSPKVKDVTLQPETGSELSYNRATATPRQPRTAVPTRSPVPQPTYIKANKPFEIDVTC